MLTGSQRVTTVMVMARPGEIRIRMIGTLPASPVATTTTILLRTTVVVTDRATSDANKFRLLYICLVTGHGESLNEGFPIFFVF